MAKKDPKKDPKNLTATPLESPDLSSGMDPEDHRYGFTENTLFEKVLCVAARAKDIHNEGRTPLVETFMSKSPVIALVEFNQGKILLEQKEPEAIVAEAGTGYNKKQEITKDSTKRNTERRPERRPERNAERRPERNAERRPERNAERRPER